MKSNLTSTLALALTLALLTGCSGGGSEIVRRGEALDVPYELIVQSGDLSTGVVDDLLEKAEEALAARFKGTAHTSDPIEALNEERSIVTTPDLTTFFELAETFRVSTDSAYDYRQGGLRKAWDFYKRKPELPEGGVLQQAIEAAYSSEVLVESDKISIRGAAEVDPGRLAEGWAVDAATEILMGGGVQRGWVRLGSVTRFWGGKSEDQALWKIVVPPLPGGSNFKLLTPPDGAFCLIHPAIGGFEYDEKIRSRILNPQTGLPPDSTFSAGAWAADGATAGAYAEAFHVMGRRTAMWWLRRHQPCGMFIIYRDKVNGETLVEVDPNLADCISDSVVTKDD
jgi:thiamine biosynthesis lipoprotein ApbE